MKGISGNFSAIRERIAIATIKSGREPGSVKLVAVSKRKPADLLHEAVGVNQLLFGESYLQEAAAKIPQLPPEVTWHFIGKVQSNKVKQIAELFDVVETIDRLKVALLLEKNLVAMKKMMPVFLQVNIGRESQKSGVLPDELKNLFKEISAMSHLEIRGLMAMPPLSDTPEMSRKYFQELRHLARQLEDQGLADHPLELSMGMSEDFEVAIEEGATVVRVGSALFGDR